MKQRKKNSAHNNGPFVMLLIEVLDAPAWRALSHGAKVLYIALRRRYHATIDNNGKIYLPQRTAKRELHSHRDQIARWFRELEHYGFIVLASEGHLGVHGFGRAPCWRLTELPYKTSRRRKISSPGMAPRSAVRKQNPGPEIRAKVARKTGPRKRPARRIRALHCN
jgi:hypothetical protein